MTAGNRMRRLGSACIAWVALSGCGLHGKPKVERDQRGVDAPSTPAVSRPEAAGGMIIAPGLTEPWGEEVAVAAKEPGWVSALLVTEGQLVKEGDVLALLDDSVQQYSLLKARADVVAAQALVNKLARGATREELDEAQKAYEAAQARGEFAAASSARNSRLSAEGAVSDVEVDKSMADAKAEAAQAAAAEARLRALTKGPRSEDRMSATAALHAAEANLKLAEAALERRRVMAPQSGTVLQSQFKAGEFYAPGSVAMFIVGELGRMQVRLEVDEVDCWAVKVGAECTVSSDAGEPLGSGKVIHLAPRMGRRTSQIEGPTTREDIRVREVVVEVPRTLRLIPGQRVWGHIPRKQSGSTSAEVQVQQASSQG